MKTKALLPLAIVVSALALSCVPGLAAPPAGATESATLRRIFSSPPVEYSTGPLWVWNDMLTEEQIRGTLRDLAEQHVKQVWVHPRPGLMTPYLGPEWFKLWRVTLSEARKLDMTVWIYDENSYPSGFAGGLVPEAMPESRGRGLVFKESKAAPPWSDKTIGVYRVSDNVCENLTAKLKAGQPLPEGPFLVASETRAANSSWHGDRCYVNLLSPGVTEKFLELTLEPYRREMGKEFGRRVPGVFTDEPNIRPAGGLPWSEILAAEFQQRWHYSLLDNLPSLTRRVGDWRKVRHNYFQLLHEQFVAHWARPYHDYCETNRLEWTGHYWDHEWPNCVGVPDNMAMYAWHQRPAIDCLMNQYAENTHAQFGNLRMPRELSSVANQLGLPRTLCEIYGAGGWDLRFEDMKRIGDWLEVLGVNTLNQHLSYVTIRGARKRDHPQSFSYHEPWWEAYHVSADYLARVSAALSQGEQINRVLVLEPTTTAWMYQGEGAELNKLGDTFFKLLLALEAAQVEYDIGCEDVIEHHGSVENGKLKIGKRIYDQVVLPPVIENLNAKTKQLLDRVGFVLSGATPSRVDGVAAGEPVPAPADTEQGVGRIVAELQQRQKTAGFAVERTPGDQGILFHHRRTLADGELVFLVNTSLEHGSTGIILSRGAGVEQFDLYTGKVQPFPHVRSQEGVSAKFDLPPSGSLLVFIGRKPVSFKAPRESVATIACVGAPEIRRLEPNVLTLDYVDVTAGGESRTNVFFYVANQLAWQKNGMDRNPWDSAVQFKDELIKRQFPPGSGFVVSYRFTLENPAPQDLAIVIERPDLYTITCNGKLVSSRAKAWWLDKAFGRLPIADFAQPGVNIVTLKATPFTMFHEIEPAYLLGSFTLNEAPRGFTVAADHPLALGANRVGWNRQGHPFYSAGVSYSEKFSLQKLEGEYRVCLSNWYGSVARVTVNGKAAGYIDAPPWECDVTRLLHRGDNHIEVAVIGTLKNLLGPHHNHPALGAAWPSAFRNAPEFGPPPGAGYSNVAYGLFEPFSLKQVTAKTGPETASR